MELQTLKECNLGSMHLVRLLSFSLGRRYAEWRKWNFSYVKLTFLVVVLLQMQLTLTALM